MASRLRELSAITIYSFVLRYALIQRERRTAFPDVRHYLRQVPDIQQ